MQSQVFSRIEALREEIARLEGTSRPPKAQSIPSGFPALDAALPEMGFRGGTLVEWLADGPGTGAATLALQAACRACRSGGALVVVDRSREFYPPAAIRLGIEPAQLIVVHPEGKADHDWAVDQSLRCLAVAAVVAWPDAPRGTLDVRTFRRLQLAAEEGGGLGLLIRPAAARPLPSWADVRLLVEPLPAREKGDRVPSGCHLCAAGHRPEVGRGPFRQMGTVPFFPRRWKVLLLRCRGGMGERLVNVEIDDETHPVLNTTAV